MPQISKRGFRILKPQEFDFHSQQHSKGYSSLDNLYALSREIGDHQRPAGDCQKWFSANYFYTVIRRRIDGKNITGKIYSNTSQNWVPKKNKKKKCTESLPCAWYHTGLGDKVSSHCLQGDFSLEGDMEKKTRPVFMGLNMAVMEKDEGKLLMRETD